MTLFNFDQMGEPSPVFFETQGTPAATALRPARGFAGLGRNHNQSVDGSASSATSLSIGTGLRTFALANQRPPGATVTAGRFAIGGEYAIASVGTTDFTAIGASANTVGVVFTATGAGSGTGTAINTAAATDAGSFAVGQEYVIIAPGDTDFTDIGAADSDVGTIFTATGDGAGTGKAINTAAFLSVFYIGKRIRCYSSEAVWVEGPITAADWDSITINADLTSGSGVHSDWYVNAVAGGSWLQLFDSLGDDGNADFIARVTGWDYFEDTARWSASNDGGIGLTGASRTTSDLDALGVAGVAVNRDHGKKAWGAYLDAVSTSLDSGITHGIEVNATALHPSELGGLTPYNVFTPRMTGVMNLAVGSDRLVFGASNPVDWVRMCQTNGGQALAGDVWRDGLLVRGADDYARAVSMPWMYGLSWYSQNSGGAAGEQEEVVRIFSSVQNSARRWRMNFTDGSLSVDEGVSAGASLFRVNWRDDATSHVAVTAGGASSSPQIGPGGAAANINFLATGKGTGRFGFGQFTSGSDAAITGYVEIVTTEGTVRKLAVIA
jgi:hypothetical protein